MNRFSLLTAAFLVVFAVCAGAEASVYSPGETGGSTHGTVGTLAISGPLTLGSSDVLNMDIWGAGVMSGDTGYDKITTTGPLALGGATLNLYALPSYAYGIGTPASNVYNLLTCPSGLSGTLTLMATPPNTAINAANPTTHFSYALSYTATNAILSITRTAGVYTWTGGDGAYNNCWDPANWDLGMAPYGYQTGMDTVNINMSINPVMDVTRYCTTAAGTSKMPFALYVNSFNLLNSGTLTLNGGSWGDAGYIYGSGSSIDGYAYQSCFTAGAGQTVQGNGYVNVPSTLGVTFTSGGAMAGNLHLKGLVFSTGGRFNPGETVNGTTHGTVGANAISGNLTLDAASALNFDVGSDTAHSDQIAVFNKMTLAGATVNLYNLSAGSGNYRLLTYGLKNTVADSAVLGAAPSGHTATLISYPTFLSAIVDPTAYTWNGASAANWSTPGNWTGGAHYPGFATTTDITTFNLSAAPTVTMDSPRTIPALQFSGSGTLTVNGSGANVLTVSNGIVIGSNQTLAGTGTIVAPISLYDTTAATATLGGSLKITGDVTVPTPNSTQTGATGGFGGVFGPGTGANGAGHSPGLVAITGNVSTIATTQWNFNLGTNATPGSTYDQVAITGAAAVNGIVNVYNTGTLAAGDFRLATFTSLPNVAFTPPTLGTTPSGHTYVLTAGTKFLDLLVDPAQYTWAGASGANWTALSSWGGVNYPGSTPATDVAIIPLGSSGTVTTTVDTASTLAALKFTGTGTFVVNGSSSNTLTVTDGIWVSNNQTLKPGSAGTTINASILLGGAAIGTATLGDTSGALRTTINGDVYTGLSPRNFAIWNTTISGLLSIGSLMTSGPLNGSNTVGSFAVWSNPGASKNVGAASSVLTVTSGNVSANVTGTVAGTNTWMTMLATSSLQFGSAAGNVTINNSGTGAVAFVLPGIVSGTNGLTLLGGASGIDFFNLATMTSGNVNCSGLTGTLTVGGGAYATGLYQQQTNAGGDFSKNLVLNLPGNGKFVINTGTGGTETFGGFNGTGLYDIETANAAGLTVDTSGSQGPGPYTFNGILSAGVAPSSFTLTKTGAGTQVFGPAVSVGGSWLGLNVNGGTLTMNGTVTNSSSVVVGTGGTLNGSGSITGSLAMSGGTLDGTLTLTGAGTSTGGVINGTPTLNGTLNHTAGTLTVNGTLGGSGLITVSGGTVNGSGAINHAMAVTGGLLAGTPSITGNVSSTGGRFTPATAGTIGTIYITGNVTLDHNSALNYDLDTPGVVGGTTNDMIDITGNLSLDGSLNINGLANFGLGIYRLFNYTGSLTGSTLMIGAVPVISDTYEFDTSTPHQVNLVVYPTLIAGDVNRDGLLTEYDIDWIYEYMRGIGVHPLARCDVSGNGSVGQEDVTYELTQYMHTNYGDANLDCYTDFTDFQVLLDHWQAQGEWTQGDFNGDGTVDFLDFQVLLDYWNPTGWSAGASQVPEPASLSLLLLGGLAFLRRSRKA